MTPELVVRWAGGSLNLMGWNDSPYGEYQVEALADGTDWGNIESVRRELRTALRDGSRTTRESDRNRTLAMALRVSSPSHSALAYGEQQIDRLDGLRCELVWTPPARLGIAPSVFVIDYSELEHRMDDQGYERGELEYALTMSALPHAYADSWITVPAIPQGSSIPVEVDDCSSTDGWTATGATLSSSGGKLTVTPMPTSTQMSATRTGPVDLTTDRYLAVWGNRPTTVEVLNGTVWKALSLSGEDGNYHIYDGTSLADPTVDGLRFTWSASSPGYEPTGLGGSLPTVALTDIRKQSAPRSTDGRQQTRAVEVPGSRRTPASLLVESPTSGLGAVLVYGGPEYNPAVARGALHIRATTSSNLSGGQSSLDSGTTIAFEVPAADFYSGSHVVYVVSRPVAGGVSTIGQLGVTVSLRGSSGPSAVAITSTSRSRSLTWDAGEVKVGLMGAVDLPGAELPDGSNAIVHVELDWTKDASYAPTDDRDLFIDEVLFFNRTLGRLLIANAGGSQKVWVDAANLDRDHDVVFAGTGPKHDAAPLSLSSELPAWSGAISLTPGTTHLYVGTTGALDSTVEATFRPAGNTHMPELAI